MSGALGVQMPAEAAALRYQIDPGPSRLTIKVTASGMLSAMGHNPTIAVGSFSGEATVTPETLDGASLRVTAKPDSLEVTDDVSQKDKSEIETKMKQEVLETSRFPEITFESTGISATKMGDTQYAANLTGNLTLHGATQDPVRDLSGLSQRRHGSRLRRIHHQADRFRYSSRLCGGWRIESERRGEMHIRHHHAQSGVKTCSTVNQARTQGRT